MSLFAALALATFAQTNPPEFDIETARRIAACGPSDADRDFLGTRLRSASYDHVGGGFQDSPGGAKRLETNAWYLNALAAAYEDKPDLFIRNMALDTAAFVLRDLKDASGGFFSSIGNAETTSYYAFSEQELRSALGPDRSREFFANFTLTPGGFPQLTGSPFAGLSDTRQTLLLRRLRRVRLPLDETIDPDSNGVWVGALARAARVFERHDFLEAARRGVALLMGSSRGSGAGAAFGLALLERFGGKSDVPPASRPLDRAVERTQRLPARDLLSLAWALAENVRRRPSSARGRQLTTVMRRIESRFAGSEDAAAARCVASTGPAPLP